MTGEKGRSSAASQSETFAAEVFETHDGSLIVADTPGSNAMTDQFAHILHFSHALNFRPVTCIVIVVKADVRIDSVIENITKYAEGIPENFPIEQICVYVTHMDLVSWSENDILEKMIDELGLETAGFSSLESTGETLKKDLLSMCTHKLPVEVSINSEQFFSMFDLGSKATKLLQEANPLNHHAYKVQ